MKVLLTMSPNSNSERVPNQKIQKETHFLQSQSGLELLHLGNDINWLMICSERRQSTM
jgi:hypothetical protein